MRIAILTAWYPKKKNPLYGVFIQNQVRALSEHCEVYVLLLNWSLIPQQKISKDGKVTIIEKRDFYLPNASEELLDFWASRYVRFFRSVHQEYQFDLLHCHDHYGAFVGDKIKNALSLPYLCTIHNSNIMNDQLVAWKKAYLPRILRNADQVIAVGTKLAHVLEEKYGIPEVQVIPNYVDTEKFSVSTVHKTKTFRFLFVGGLEPHKGILEILEAFHRADFIDAQLHIVGSGILDKKLKDYIQNHALQDKVKMHGEIPNDALPEIYQNAQVYVTASSYETFGVTVLEAMSCGLPVLYTASGGPEELVRDFAGLKIEERTAKGVMKGMKQIKAEIDRFDRHRIRNYVVANFGSDQVIRRLLDAYKSILHEKV